jgi:squalene-hopene/tetraprenyl-beta-curcumene cyclase
VHPFTGSSPGGWGWTDSSGAVPDADDTPGALLALAGLREGASAEEVRRIDGAAEAGLGWLVRLQNRDGGWPTFCRGWGKMPFDRSSPDLTAHALRALHKWSQMPAPHWDAPTRLLRRGFRFLAGQQRPDGSWVPLWFGNQRNRADENPAYGTARVLLAYRQLGMPDSEPARRGLAWLVSAQHTDGGWGSVIPPESGGQNTEVSTIEETAVAVEALVACGGGPEFQAAADRGIAWLVGAVEEGRHREPSPIGFYFAKLWYYERLYPLIFTAAALGRAVRRLPRESDTASARPGHCEPAS